MQKGGLDPPSAAAASSRARTSGSTKRSADDEIALQIVKKRFQEAIESDIKAVLEPDYKTPFKDGLDVINRLLPYHIFQYPSADLDLNVRSDEEETKIAISLHQRRYRLHQRLRNIIKNEAAQSLPTPTSNWLLKGVTESQRIENSELAALHRTLSAQLSIEKSRIEARRKEQEMKGAHVAQVQKLQAQLVHAQNEGKLPEGWDAILAASSGGQPSPRTVGKPLDAGSKEVTDWLYSIVSRGSFLNKSTTASTSISNVNTSSSISSSPNTNFAPSSSRSSALPSNGKVSSRPVNAKLDKSHSSSIDS